MIRALNAFCVALGAGFLFIEFHHGNSLGWEVIDVLSVALNLSRLSVRKA